MDEAQVAGWHGRAVYDRDGRKVGTLEDAFLDERTGEPAWATVSAGLFGRRHHFLPLRGAREVDDGIAVPIDGALVGDAPGVDRDGDLSPQDEHRLYAHYGIDDEVGSGAAGPDDNGHPDAADDARRGEDEHADRTAVAGGADDRREEDDGATGGQAPTADDGATGARRSTADDDATGPPPDDLRDRQTAAATAAAERAEREQQAAALDERDRVAVAPGATDRRDGPDDPQDVLPQTDATGDLDAAPSDHLTGATDHGAPVPDARFVGRPTVDDDHHVVRDRIIDPTAGAGDAGSAADAGSSRPEDAADDRGGQQDGPARGDAPFLAPRTGARPGTPGGTPERSGRETARPGLVPRLRRLARTITPSKDDHHG